MIEDDQNQFRAILDSRYRELLGPRGNLSRQEWINELELQWGEILLLHHPSSRTTVDQLVNQTITTPELTDNIHQLFFVINSCVYGSSKKLVELEDRGVNTDSQIYKQGNEYFQKACKIKDVFLGLSLRNEPINIRIELKTLFTHPFVQFCLEDTPIV